MLLDYKINWETISSSPVFQALRELNIIDETELRNVMIREEYRELRKYYNSTRALEVLMKKYSMSDLTIRNIIYRPKDKDSNQPLVLK